MTKKMKIKNKGLVKTIHKEIKKEERINQERKYVTVLKSHINVSVITLVADIAQAFHLNGIPGGSSVSARIGNTIKPRSLKLNWRTYTKNTNLVESLTRVVIVHDRNPNGQTPSFSGTQITSVMDDVGTGGPDVQCMQLEMARPRFRILSDQIVPLHIGSNVSAVQIINPIAFREIDIKLNLPQTRFSDTGATIASCVEGAIFLFVLADEPGFFEFNSRFFYTDA